MKYLPLIFSVADGGHFRAVGLHFIQDKNDKMMMTRTQAWRRRYSGYGYKEGCTEDHVRLKTLSRNSETRAGFEWCHLTNGTDCGAFLSSYVVTDIESSLGDPNDFCYGSKEETIDKANLIEEKICDKVNMEEEDVIDPEKL